MNVRLYASPDLFGPIARRIYHKDPVSYTTELTILRTSRWPADRVLLSIGDADSPVGAALQMRDAVLLVNGLPPESAMEAAAALSSVQPDLPAVRGTSITAAAFSQAWAEVTGVTSALGLQETLYRLDELRLPTGVAGSARTAREEDGELIVEWLDAFFVEAFGATPASSTASVDLLRDIAAAGGQIVLWTVDGAPVAMARVHGCLLGMSRIGPVYTPPQNRGHGYGAAVSAEAVRQAQHLGARDVVLFANVANPVSNRIYQRLGFVKVADHMQYAFSA